MKFSEHDCGGYEESKDNNTPEWRKEQMSHFITKKLVLKKLKEIQSDLLWRSSHETNSEACIRGAEQKLQTLIEQMS